MKRVIALFLAVVAGLAVSLADADVRLNAARYLQSTVTFLTADGLISGLATTQRIFIGNSADVTKGAYIKVNQNTATGAGDVVIDGGNAAGSDIFIRTQVSSGTITFATDAGTQALKLNSDQSATFASTVSSTGLLFPTANEEAVAGAGSSVSDAAALSATKHVHQLTGANGTVGWKFATSAAGQFEFLLNTTAGVPKIYAASGGTCNGGAANAACTLLSGIVAHICYSTAADTWICS